MKIGLLNFGPIKKFEIDLSKDLSLIFGKNNIGKSYSIRAVYLIIKDLLAIRGELYHGYILAPNLSRFKPIQYNKETRQIEQSIYKRLKRTPKNELDATKEISDLSAHLLEDYASTLQNSLSNSFSGIENLKNFNSSSPLEIIIESDGVTVSIVLRYNRLEVKSVALTKKYVVKLAKTDRSALNRGNVVRFYCRESIPGEFEPGFMGQQAFSVVRNLLDKLTLDTKAVYFLPASRSGLYEALNAFSAVIAELSKSRRFTTQRIEIPTISEPVADYFLNLSTISGRIVHNKYQTIAKEIEDSILGGVISIDKDTKKIVYLPKGPSRAMDLSITSSMISEIAPIVAFLKYVLSDRMMRSRRYSATGKNLIFFEEPEAHLHPEIQIEMMRIFKMLIDDDVQLVITTHSNYMFNKLGNMIISKEINQNRIASYLMTMKKGGSVLDSDSMKVSEEGIPDDNFSNASEKLFNEREEIYNSMD